MRAAGLLVLAIGGAGQAPLGADTAQLFYACTPFSDYSLYVRHRETEVWRYPRTAQTKGWVEVKELIKLPENAQAPKGGER